MTFENLNINRVVVHEIHKRTEARDRIEPTYGTQLVSLEDDALEALCDRITTAMGSASRSVALDIIHSGVDSAVAISNDLVDADDTLFIHRSKLLADKLTDAQMRRNLPGGVLVVFSGTVGYPSKRVLGIIKAETHNGFTHGAGAGGVTTLKFLKELLLTPQTKLYKIGIFCEQTHNSTGVLPAEWKAYVYDDQISAANKLTAAQYFYESFLGCAFPESSARKTKEFHDYTKEFIQKLDWPQERKVDLHNALVTYLKVDQSATVQVASFAQSYLPDASSRDSYMTFMANKSFPQEAIVKDLADVSASLKTRKVTFSKEVKITAPADKFEDLIRMRVIEGDALSDGQIPLWTEVIIRDRIRDQE